MDIFINSIMPGTIIGSIAKKVINDENSNKQEPVFAGIIIIIISIVVHYLISKYVIKTDLLEENIPNKLKAFLILLKCICLNNTNYTGYNKSEICKKLNISRPTLDSYLNQCIDKELIKEEQDGYTLTNTHLFKIDIVKGKDDDEVYTKVYIPMADFFASQNITIPPYNKKIVGKIIDHYSALPFLAAALKKRKIPEGTVCTWKYLAKVLKVNIVEKPRPIPPKVTLIM